MNEICVCVYFRACQIQHFAWALDWLVVVFRFVCLFVGWPDATRMSRRRRMRVRVFGIQRRGWRLLARLGSLARAQSGPTFMGDSRPRPPLHSRSRKREKMIIQSADDKEARGSKLNI